MIEADEQLATRVQDEEQELYSIEEKTRLLVEMIAERKRFFAAQRAAEQRSKPPTKTQMRNRMCTYLKNIGGYKHNQLKEKSYEEIQKLFDKTYKQVNSFVPMASDDKEKGSEKKAGGSRKKTLAKKRAGEKQSVESYKRQKMEHDAKKEELRTHLDIIPGDNVAVSVELLATKYPIVDWKTHVLSEDKMYYEIIRANGSTKSYKIFIEMLDDFDRQDVLDLYRLIKERLFDSCGVHVLLIDIGIAIHMLVEKTYSLTQDMLSRMLSEKLEVDNESEMAFELLRFTRSQIEKDLNIAEDLRLPEEDNDCMKIKTCEEIYLELGTTVVSSPHVAHTISTVKQTSTPILTPPITTDAPTITTTVPKSDALSAIKKEQVEKQKIQKFTIKSIDKASLKEFDQKSALYQTMHANKSFSRNPANHRLYHALMEALTEDKNAMDKGVADTIKDYKRKHDDDEDDDDEDPPTGPNQGKKTKRRRTKESESSKKPSTTKEPPKGKDPSKGSKTGKSASAKEPVEEPTAEVVMDDTSEDVVCDDDQPQDTSKPKTTKTPNLEWFTQPPRPPTPDPE
ncbi:hypothetical protein Tco_1145514 [Tanacetum coccineum]